MKKVLTLIAIAPYPLGSNTRCCVRASGPCAYKYHGVWQEKARDERAVWDPKFLAAILVRCAHLKIEHTNRK
jgi:hypothetical protein